MLTQAIGWISSVVLVATIAKQVHKQWKAGTSEGVSSWLFVGQVTASTGFTIYSVLIEAWVFVFTNSLMMLSGLVGLLIVRYHRRMQAPASPPSQLA
jgi:MtN3 and saliva related transmembrane protein